MKIFYIILIFFFISCTLTEDTGQVDSSPIVLSVDDRVAKLEVKVANSEIKIFKLEQDTIFQAKQIAAQAKEIVDLKKYNVTNNIQNTSTTAKISDLAKRHERDSVLQWVQIKPSTAMIPKFNLFRNSYISDSIKQWVYINQFIPITPRLNSFINIFKFDSTKQWFDINRLKTASPVVQIPIMQSDIKKLQAKDVSQDKFIVAHTEGIKNINDTIDVLKITAGSDFGVGLNGQFQISQTGMKRIKAELQQ